MTDELETRLPITPGARWSFGTGGIVWGVIWNAHYFVLVFYSQVLGLDPGLAGLAIGVGLIVDAITDPLTGYLSDNTRSRWGRRHPYLYASVVPLALSYFLIWHPPAFVTGDAPLFAYLICCNIALRISTTIFLVPAFSMVAELTSDYDERTRLLTRFNCLVSVVGNGMSVLMYAVWLVPSEQYADGIMNMEGYQRAGVFGTVAIAGAVLAFAVGLHRYIPRLIQFKAPASVGIKQFFRQVHDVLRIASLRSVIVSALFYYAGTGAYAALWVYIYSYFWEFSSYQISFIVIPMVLGGLLLPPVLARFTEGREKKRVALFGLLGAIMVNVFPIAMRLLGMFPANHTEVLFWTMLTLGFFETILFLFYDVCWRSMTADVTEQNQLETGRRNEGVISSAVTFVTKCANALGTLIAGTMLTIIAFPTGTAVGKVPEETIFNLGLVYGPMILVIWLCSCYAINRYRITRVGHSEVLVRLADG